MSYFSYHRIAPHDRRMRFPTPRPAAPGEWPELEAALAVVNRDVKATLPGERDLVLMVVDSAGGTECSGEGEGAQVYVAMADGHWQGNAVNDGECAGPMDAEAVLARVADAAQETVSELLWRVWPVCREHRLGVHVRSVGDGGGSVGWWCRGGGCHEVAAVGELVATLSGKERRALRRR